MYVVRIPIDVICVYRKKRKQKEKRKQKQEVGEREIESERGDGWGQEWVGNRNWFDWNAYRSRYYYENFYSTNEG